MTGLVRRPTPNALNDPSTYCPRDHGCSLPKGHDGNCELTAALCFCAECEAKADERMYLDAPVSSAGLPKDEQR